MLRACVLVNRGSWVDYLPLAEFIYNNGYQSSIGMAPYETLYGRPCRSPYVGLKWGRVVCWGPKLSKKQHKRSVLLRRNLKLPKIDKRVMQIRGEDP